MIFVYPKKIVHSCFGLLSYSNIVHINLEIHHPYNQPTIASTKAILLDAFRSITEDGPEDGTVSSET